jgi:thioredoxin-dependent peroxiredoxin
MRSLSRPLLLAPLLLLAAACSTPKRPDGGEGLLPAGAAAPDLTAVDQHAQSHRLSEERGHAVIVYFYPKDGTPGCTHEACAFRDVWAKYEAAGV